jgi:hypothetical protein
MRFTDYQALIISFSALLNLICCCLVVFTCYTVVRFKEFRDALTEAIQDGDKVFHWVDAKSFGYFIAGWLSAWFTMNVAFVFAYEKMFDLGPLGFLGMFIGVTFTLWGIAWKKN